MCVVQLFRDRQRKHRLCGRGYSIIYKSDLQVTTKRAVVASASEVTRVLECEIDLFTRSILGLYAPPDALVQLGDVRLSAYEIVVGWLGLRRFLGVRSN